jgi:uncharacterized membrane protein
MKIVILCLEAMYAFLFFVHNFYCFIIALFIGQNMPFFILYQIRRTFMKTKKVITRKYSSVQKLTFSGLTMAIYIVVMYLTRGFAFGQYQIRIATSVYALSAIFPFLIVPMGLSNMLSNILMGGFGIIDALGGLAVGLITSTCIYLIKRYNLNDWLIAIPIIIFPGLLVPIWLSIFIKAPYSVLAISLLIGQVIPGIVGVILVKQLKNKF